MTLGLNMTILGTMLASFIIFVLVMSGIGLGMLFGRKPRTKTCNNMDNDNENGNCCMGDRCHETRRGNSI